MTNDHEAQAVAGAVQVARSLGLRVDEPVVLASAYAVRVHLKPSPYVARVPTQTAWLRNPIEPWLAREIDVARYLVNAGAPVVSPARDVDPGPHRATSSDSGATSVVSLWEHVNVVPDRGPTQADFGRMLGALHEALRGFTGDLPVLGPPANDIVAALSRIESEGLVPSADLEVLRHAHERMRPAIEEPRGPLQPLHGDAHPGNLIATDQGLLWNDLEDVCRGPVAWDLASMMLSDEAVSAYPSPPEASERALYRELRRLHVLTWMLALPFDFEGRAAVMESLLRDFREAAAR